MPLMGSWAEPPDPAEVFASGAVDQVLRPLRSQELLARMEAHLALKVLRNQPLIKDAELQREAAHHNATEQQLRQSE